MFWILVFFVATCGFSAAQVPPNPLFQSQDAINLYHDYYEDLKVQIRDQMTDYVRATSGEVIETLTSMMDTWRRHSGRRSTPEIGYTIMGCIDVVFDRLLDHQHDILDGLEEWQDYITGLQISVVEKLVEFDIVRRYDYFIDYFNPVIQEAHNRLQYEFVPSMETRLRNLFDSHDEITNNFQQCISTVLV